MKSILEEHAAFFEKEADRIIGIIRKDGKRFDIYQTIDGKRNFNIFEQEIKSIVSYNLCTPERLLNEYPLPYILPKIISDIVKARILEEPEIFIID